VRSPAAPASEAVRRRRTGLSTAEWRILLLLTLSAFLNYVDRTNLSVGATDIQGELHLSNYSLGLLGSAFFWTYAAFQLGGIAGWVVDRWNVCWVYAIAFLAWSGATAVSGMARGFLVFFGLRLLLGMGESVAYPSYSRILANHFPEHHRGFANALIDAGTKAGPALGALLGGLFMKEYGWRAFFVVLGLGSLLWLIPWIRWSRNLPGSTGAGHGPALPAPGIWEIVRRRPVLATAFGLFSTNYFWYFLITWLPAYMEKERHFDKSRMAVFASAAFLAVALSSVCCGWLSDRWIARGGTPTRVRKSFAGWGLVFSTIILPVAVVPDNRVAMPLLILACTSFGAYTSNVFAITQTLAGPRAAGKWTGFQNGVANLAGVAAPWVTGFIVDQTHAFYWAFVVATAIVLCGAACFVVGIEKIEEVEW
jgi:MFS family permease